MGLFMIGAIFGIDKSICHTPPFAILPCFICLFYYFDFVCAYYLQFMSTSEVEVLIRLVCKQIPTFRSGLLQNSSSLSLV